MVDEIPLSEPDITDVEVAMVERVLRSKRLSIGPVNEQRHKFQGWVFQSRPSNSIIRRIR